MKLSEFKNTKLKVVEVFNSISGEGISTGEIVTFVRVEGCNLRCSYCDTRYSYQGDNYELLTLAEILEKLESFGTDKVICTGGEPLVEETAKRYLPLFLAAKGYEVRVESNGSWPVYNKEEIEAYSEGQKLELYYTLDVKCPSSGMAQSNYFSNFAKLKSGDELKFVVSNDRDLDYALRVIDKHKKSLAREGIVINFSPAFSRIEPEEIVEFLQEHQSYFKENNLEVRLSMQLHKLIWDPDEKGV
ncbi:radical SAM protein [Halanaerobacter jeridensis]|uniref:7-carboxy-7-deazaguanine synthase n=1 Tax=Halanaerobacter jeridensis TaxID=706427 RepID=A0A938XQW4_9FIRM|nr:radical SAM protein [Halanaerobacter jeridensis]MBM7557877.1 7-carboxy-7-deazaguanine synthase [Halanaerobacter jeridensis]